MAHLMRRHFTKFGSGYVGEQLPLFPDTRPLRNIFFDIETGGQDAASSSILTLATAGSQDKPNVWAANPTKGSFVTNWSRENVIPQLKHHSLIQEEQLLSNFQGQLNSGRGGDILGWNVGFDIGFAKSRAAMYGQGSALEASLSNYRVRDVGREAIFHMAPQVEQNLGKLNIRHARQWQPWISRVNALKAANPNISAIEAGQQLMGGDMPRGSGQEAVYKALGLGEYAAHRAEADVEALRTITSKLEQTGTNEFFDNWIKTIYPAAEATVAKPGIVSRAKGLISSHPKLAITAGIASLGIGYFAFSGRDDQYNSIHGLRHGGMAERNRRQTTEFGSGWQGLQVHGQEIPIEIQEFREKWIDSGKRNELRTKIAAQQDKYGLLRPEEITPISKRKSRVDISAYTPTFADADTLILQQPGWKFWAKDVAIRMTGIDAPEVEHPDDPTAWYHFKQAQPFGQEATRMAEQLVSGKKVGLTIATEAAKTYGRYLGIVDVGEGKSINQQLIEQGGAAALPWGKSGSEIYSTKEFLASEKAAIESGAGMWSEPFFQNYTNIAAAAGHRITFNQLTDLSRLAQNYNLAASESFLWKSQEEGTIDSATGRKLGRRLHLSKQRQFAGRRAIGKDDAHNTIEGLRHGGLSEQKRRELTDFGSGWNPFRKIAAALYKDAPDALEQLIGSKGFRSALSRGKIVRPFTQGGYGSAELLESEFLGQRFRYVRKTMLEEASREDFMAEVGAMERLGGENAPSVYQHNFQEGRAGSSIYMEAFEGEDVWSLLQRGERLTPAQVLQLNEFLGIAEAAGYQHLDLARVVTTSQGESILPHNIIRTKEDKLGVIDWGVTSQTHAGQSFSRTAMKVESKRISGTPITPSSGKIAEIAKNSQRENLINALIMQQGGMNVPVKKIPGWDDAYNTIEGLKHQGLAAETRPDYGFGSGFLGILGGAAKKHASGHGIGHFVQDLAFDVYAKHPVKHNIQGVLSDHSDDGEPIHKLYKTLNPLPKRQMGNYTIHGMPSKGMAREGNIRSGFGTHFNALKKAILGEVDVASKEGRKLWGQFRRSKEFKGLRTSMENAPLTKLKQGGFGTTYTGTASLTYRGQTHQVPFVKKEMTGVNTQRGYTVSKREFGREVKAMLDLGHSIAPDVYSASGKSKSIFMEAIEGEDAASLLRKGGELSKEQIGQLRQGITEAHGLGWSHGDILRRASPGRNTTEELVPWNVMVTPKGVAVIDWGTAIYGGGGSKSLQKALGQGGQGEIMGAPELFDKIYALRLNTAHLNVDPDSTLFKQFHGHIKDFDMMIVEGMEKQGGKLSEDTLTKMRGASRSQLAAPTATGAPSNLTTASKRSKRNIQQETSLVAAQKQISNNAVNGGKKHRTYGSSPVTQMFDHGDITI